MYDFFYRKSDAAHAQANVERLLCLADYSDALHDYGVARGDVTHSQRIDFVLDELDNFEIDVAQIRKENARDLKNQDAVGRGNWLTERIVSWAAPLASAAIGVGGVLVTRAGAFSGRII